MVKKERKLPKLQKPLQKSKSPPVSKPSPITSLSLPFLLLTLLLVKIGHTTGKIISFPVRHVRSSWLVVRRRKKKQTNYRKRLRRLINRLIPKPSRWKIILAGLALVLLLQSILVAKLVSGLPSPDRINLTRPMTTQILDRNGKLLYQIYEGRNRELIKIDSLPPYLIQATVAIEDKHFFSHPGIDPLGIFRALKTNINEGKLEGGSTITQQLVKNTLLTPDQTLTRKIKEVVLAFWTESIYNKQQILQMYFNEAPYGGPAWGIEAAARMYFGKSARDLSLPEATYLAGLPAAPTDYSPYGAHPEKGRKRQKEVLRRMVEDKYLSQTQADEVLNQSLTFQPPTSTIKAPHFVMYVRSLLAQKYGERVVSQGGLKVVTTLDLDVQKMAEDTVKKDLDELSVLKVGNGAAMVTDAKSGQILAMAGSKDYFNPNGGNFNATLALRQPGSSIKVVTYAAAFKESYSPGSILFDTPTTFTNPWGQGYSPVNYDGRFHGPVTIRTALGSSYNVPAVKMLAQVGIPAMIQTAREMGITTFDKPESYGLSLTLGAGAVKMIDMMSVYGTLASEGVKFTPQPILTVTDSYGNVLEDHREPEGKRVLTEEVSYLLDHVLADPNARIPAFGPHSLLEIPGHTVAVKTGTSDDKRDNWAFGFTSEYVVGAWVGNNDYSPMNPALTSGITGATPIWHDIMTYLISNQPDIAFKRPDGIIETVVDGHKDLAISGQVSKTVVGLVNHTSTLTAQTSSTTP